MLGSRRPPASIYPAMCSTRTVVGFLLLSSLVALVSAQKSTSPWQTLSGNSPVVIARGGFSGIFPDSSISAYQLGVLLSLLDVVSLCDVQLTKEGAGICAPFLQLENYTNIATIPAFKTRFSTYVVNGVSTKGWFSIDFTLKDLSNVFLTQGIYSRSNRFDGTPFNILTVQELDKQVMLPALWLNIQHDQFFSQHNLSMRNFVLSTVKTVPVAYISSPEARFLRGIAAQFSGTTTKLVYRFLGQNDVDSSTNQTYKSLLANLTSIKSFASAILVPKYYIWPVDQGNYLLPHTTLVSDAHKAGLEVYASEFINDIPLSYNYSYDPIRESLQYIDNGEFSVDGVLTDFPVTPSAAIDCFAHIGKNASGQASPLVISYNGASGDYPDCTDLAYQAAIADGANIIDCTVQISKDGTPFCFSSINLMEGSTAAQSAFRNRTLSVPELSIATGICAFSLTWEEIQTLTPAISNPYSSGSQMFRNPRLKNAGKFVSLSQFLDTATNTSLSGVLIRIENAAYLAENQGLGVIDAVLDTLNKSGFSDQKSMKVLIQSTNSSALLKIKNSAPYELVYEVDENIRDADNSTVLDIKNFAHSVVVTKESVFPTNKLFVIGAANTVGKLQAFNLSVYVRLFSNEFLSQAWDYFSDGTIEINSFVMGMNIDGVITDFPKTAASYKKNRCLGLGSKTPPYMAVAQPGSLYNLITAPYLPPAEAPLPVLNDDDVTEPPLPPVTPKAPALSPTLPPPVTRAPPPNHGHPTFAVPVFLSCLAVLSATLLLL